MPRPTKFSQAIADRILGVLRAGNTRTASALYVGISYTTLKDWAHRFPQFSAALDHAEAEAEVYCVAILRRAIQEGDTAAAKWWLERRRNEDWRQHDKVDLEIFVRQRAGELGLDPDEAVLEASRILGQGRWAN